MVTDVMSYTYNFRAWFISCFFLVQMCIGDPPKSERFSGFFYQRKHKRGSFVEHNKEEMCKENLQPFQHVCKQKITRESFRGKNEAQYRSVVLHPFRYFYKRRTLVSSDWESSFSSFFCWVQSTDCLCPGQTDSFIIFQPSNAWW